MLNEQSIYEVGGLLAAGYGIYQAKALHDKELRRAKRRHQEAVELAKLTHDHAMKTLKQTYLLGLFHSLEQHFQQLNADLIMNSRESERDMFDQRNQGFQIIILSSSIMFASLSCIIVGSDIPRNSGKFFVVAYALLTAMSFSFLFLCIVFCFELVSRTALFMYKRGKMHSRSLKNAIDDTKKMMRDLRGDRRGNSSAGNLRTNVSGANLTGGLFQQEDDAARRARDSFTRQNVRSNSTSSISSNFSDINDIRGIRRAISQMQPNEIEEEFERHEMEIQGYMKRREVLNYSSTINMHRNRVTGHKRSFRHFWDESCELWWNLSILFFYAGSLSMLLVLMIYMWSAFILSYNSLIAATIGVIVLGMISVLGFVVTIVMTDVDERAKRRYVLDMHATTSFAPTQDSKRRSPEVMREEEKAYERMESGTHKNRWMFFRNTRAANTSSGSSFSRENSRDTHRHNHRDGSHLSHQDSNYARTSSSPRGAHSSSGSPRGSAAGLSRAATAPPAVRSQNNHLYSNNVSARPNQVQRDASWSSATTDSKKASSLARETAPPPPRRGAARAALQSESHSDKNTIRGLQEGRAISTGSAGIAGSANQHESLHQQHSFDFPDIYPPGRSERRSPRRASDNVVSIERDSSFSTTSSARANYPHNPHNRL